jgi:predicted metal-dependent hydrolase
MKLSDYTIRYSNKAKYLQLRISRKGIEVVVPAKKQISESHINDFILQKRDWLDKAQQKYWGCQAELGKPALPNIIELPAIDQVWNVTYIPTHHQRVTIHTSSDGQIRLMGNIANEDACLRLLKHWLKQLAEHHLSAMIHAVSSQVAIPFHQVSIRNNTTRWGSCTSQKNISLCCRLLFLPFNLVKHVLLHELCHTKVMHHGDAFWRILLKLDSNTPEHVKALKKAGHVIPAWVS